MRNCMILLGLVVGTTSTGVAQTAISGTVQCGKPDTAYSLPVGDSPDHAFGISKVKCTWTKPLEVAGLQTKEDEITGFSEITGNTAAGRSYVVGTASNGDKMFVRPQGKSVLKGGALQSATGTWTYTGGTGKLKGLTGKGTYKCTGNADGTSTCEIEGTYQLPR